MTDSPRPTPEPERLDPPQDWADRPAINPRYKGMTPSDLARALLRPRNPKARAALDRLRSPGGGAP